MQSQGTTQGSQVVCPRGTMQYIWQEGDTLTILAIQNRVTAQSIELINPDVDFSTITAGTTICLPPQIFSCLSGTLYEVANGDTFQSIAEAFGISTLELAERNPNVSEGNLLIGQLLCVPKKESTGDSGSSGGGATGFSCPIGYSAKTIQEGQSYADLLLDSNVSYRAMRMSNPNIVPGKLVAGTQFCAPPYGTRQICGRSAKSYTIQPMETLESLAVKLNVSQGRLLQMNPTLVPSDFSSGTVICVP